MTTVIASEAARQLGRFSRSRLLFTNPHSQLNFTVILLIDIWLDEKAFVLKSTLTAVDACDEPRRERHEWAMKDDEYRGVLNLEDG